MIEEGHKVITLQATDNGHQGVSLEYNVVGEDVSYADEIKLSDSYKNDFHVNLKVQYFTCHNSISEFYTHNSKLVIALWHYGLI